jgi:hypothetical protein
MRIERPPDQCGVNSYFVRQKLSGTRPDPPGEVYACNLVSHKRERRLLAPPQATTCANKNLGCLTWPSRTEINSKLTVAVRDADNVP